MQMEEKAKKVAEAVLAAYRVAEAADPDYDYYNGVYALHAAFEAAYRASLRYTSDDAAALCCAANAAYGVA